MFDPIKARLASSFSKNGISAAATDTNCLGDTSIMVISLGGTSMNSPFRRHDTNSSPKLPSVFKVELA